MVSGLGKYCLQPIFFVCVRQKNSQAYALAYTLSSSLNRSLYLVVLFGNFFKCRHCKIAWAFWDQIQQDNNFTKEWFPLESARSSGKCRRREVLWNVLYSQTHTGSNRYCKECKQSRLQDFYTLYRLLWLIKICSWNWIDSFEVSKFNEKIRKTRCKKYNLLWFFRQIHLFSV